MSKRNPGAGGIASANPLDVLKATPATEDGHYQLGGTPLVAGVTFQAVAAAHALVLAALIARTGSYPGVTYQLQLYSKIAGAPGVLVASTPSASFDSLPTTPKLIGGPIPSTALAGPGTDYFFVIAVSAVCGLSWSTDSASTQHLFSSATNPPVLWNDEGSLDLPILQVLGTLD